VSRQSGTEIRKKLFYFFSPSLLARKSNQNAFVLLYEVMWALKNGFGHIECHPLPEAFFFPMR
jgi:hypothetical protein